MRHDTTKKITTALVTTCLAVFIPACMGVSIRPIMKSLTLGFGAELYQEFAKKQENASIMDSTSYKFWHYSRIGVRIAAFIYAITSQDIFDGRNEFSGNMVSAITSSKDVCHVSPYSFLVSGFLLSPRFWITGIAMDMYGNILTKSINNAVGAIVGNILDDEQMNIMPDLLESALVTLGSGLVAGIGGYRLIGSLPIIGWTITDRAAGREI